MLPWEVDEWDSDELNLEIRLRSIEAEYSGG